LNELSVAPIIAEHPPIIQRFSTGFYFELKAGEECVSVDWQRLRRRRENFASGTMKARDYSRAF
jgi:hypothetical protein